MDRCLIFLGKGCFRKGGGHPKKSGHPHPEDGARPAGGNRRGGSGNVSRTYLGRHRGGEGLEGAHPVGPCLVASQLHIAKDRPQPLPEPAHLDKPQPEGKPNPRSAQQKQQCKIPQKAVDRPHNLLNQRHFNPSSSLRKRVDFIIANGQNSGKLPLFFHFFTCPSRRVIVFQYCTHVLEWWNSSGVSHKKNLLPFLDFSREAAAFCDTIRRNRRQKPSAWQQSFCLDLSLVRRRQAWYNNGNPIAFFAQNSQ